MARRGLPFRHPAMLLATAGGAGLMPWAPGTWGSLLAAILAWFLIPAIGSGGLVALAVAAFPAGWWAGDRVARASGIADPGFVVIDEVVGQWLVLALAPRTLISFGAGFVLFRIADIVKPWPIRGLEGHFRNGFGIMIDDVGAAVYAGLVLYVSLKIFG